MRWRPNLSDYGSDIESVARSQLVGWALLPVLRFSFSSRLKVKTKHKTGKSAHPTKTDDTPAARVFEAEC